MIAGKVTIAKTLPGFRTLEISGFGTIVSVDFRGLLTKLSASKRDIALEMRHRPPQSGTRHPQLWMKCATKWSHERILAFEHPQLWIWRPQSGIFGIVDEFESGSRLQLRSKPVLVALDADLSEASSSPNLSKLACTNMWCPHYRELLRWHCTVKPHDRICGNSRYSSRMVDAVVRRPELIPTT